MYHILTFLITSKKYIVYVWQNIEVLIIFWKQDKVYNFFFFTNVFKMVNKYFHEM